MRAAQIIDGATYTDQRGSVRLVVGPVDPPPLAITRDWIAYRILSGKHAGPKVHHLTRAAFASWARERVETPDRSAKPAGR